MGMFKQFKDMVGVVNEMPAMVQQANALQAEAARVYAQHGGGRYAGVYGVMPQPADLDAGDARLAPIEGVTLARYAEISKAAATYGLDQAGLAQYVTTRGYDPEVWNRAAAGWNARFHGDMQLATHFGRLYQEAQV